MVVYFCSLNKRHGVFCIGCRLARVFWVTVVKSSGQWGMVKMTSPRHNQSYLNVAITYPVSQYPNIGQEYPNHFRMIARIVSCISAVILKYTYIVDNLSHIKVYPWQSQLLLMSCQLYGLTRICRIFKKWGIVPLIEEIKNILFYYFLYYLHH